MATADRAETLHLRHRTVLVAVDESDASHRVVTFVNAFFHGLGVEVIGINVGHEPASWIPTGLAAGGYFYWPYVGESPAPARRDHEDLREAAETIEASGLIDDGVVVELGDPAEHIRSAAIEHRADLIVIGDSHKSGWRRFLEGSVTSDLQSQAPCPVLVVP